MSMIFKYRWGLLNHLLFVRIMVALLTFTNIASREQLCMDLPIHGKCVGLLLTRQRLKMP